MTEVAYVIKHRTKPGSRDDVRKIWEKHMLPAVSANPHHLAYFYCFENSSEDSICAFQVYENEAAARSFLETESYASYLSEVDEHLSGPPEVIALTPVWIK